MQKDSFFISNFQVSHQSSATHPVTLYEASFKWNDTPSDPTILKGITLNVKEGSLVRYIKQVLIAKVPLVKHCCHYQTENRAGFACMDQLTMEEI